MAFAVAPFYNMLFVLSSLKSRKTPLNILPFAGKSLSLFPIF